MIKKLPFFVFLCCSTVQSQYINYEIFSSVQGLLYSEENSPFWMHSNKRGRIDEKTNVAGYITGSGTYILRDESTLKLGLGVLYQDGYSKGVKLDEYYLQYQNNWMQAYAGRKQKWELYRGLSATNENMLSSLNSRPLPGISFNIPEAVPIWKEAGLGFKLAWEEFFLDEYDRNIQNIRIHHKSFHLVFSGFRNLTLSAGVDHYVQWAGKSPEHGDLPSGLEDYFRVITGGGISGGTGLVGENEINGLGNHLGGYEASLKTSYSHYIIELIYNTIFEDMSGIKLRNTPDGRYGIYIEDQEQNKLVEAFMYEFYFTRNQSKNYPTTDGKDNYFNNNLYRAGWTYENRIIGLPFILLDEDRFRVAHNNIVAHHIGITGDAFYRYPYKLLTSYRANYGVKSGSSKPQERIISTYLDLNVWQRFLNVNVQIGGDFNFEASENIGFGIKVSRRLL